MDQEKDKLNRFIEAVNSVTDKQVKDILDDARSQSGSIIAAAERSAAEAKQRRVDDNSKMISNKYVRMVSKAELDMKKQVLIAREELTHELFDKVRERLAAYRGTEEYAKQLCAACASENDLENAQICLAPEDMHLKDKIIAAVGHDVDVAADDSVKLGGFLVLRREQGTVTDRTFDCAFREQQSLFASRNLMTREGGSI